MDGAQLPGNGLGLRGRERPASRQGEGLDGRLSARLVQPGLRRLLYPHQGLGQGGETAGVCRASCQGLAEEPPVVPPGTDLHAAGTEEGRLQCVQEGRRRRVDRLPHQVQRPHQAERGVPGYQHQGRGQVATHHDALRPQRRVPGPDLLRHRQSVHQPQGYRRGNEELPSSRGEIHPQRHRQGPGAAGAGKPVLPAGRLCEGSALLLRGRAAASGDISRL